MGARGVYFRRGVTFSLMAEAILSALRLSQLLPSLAFLPLVPAVLVGARLVVTALEFTAARFLSAGRPGGPLLASWVLLGSGSLVIPEVGLRLAPTDLDPTFKWGVVGAYWTYVLVAQVTLRFLRRSASGARVEPIEPAG